MKFVHLKASDLQIYGAIVEETTRQHEFLDLTSQGNYVSQSVIESLGSSLVNTCADGYVDSRWYNGCEVVDEVEELAKKRLLELFGADHANVQPYSRAQANFAVYSAVLHPTDTVMVFDISCNGQTSSFHAGSVVDNLYTVEYFGVNPLTEQIDYDEMFEQAKRTKPKMIVIGSSVYPRCIDFSKIRRICDAVEAYLLIDISYYIGAIFTEVFMNPVLFADFITSSTQGGLRGVRGGIILCKKEFAKKIDAVTSPGLQISPFMHTIAAKAVGFKEALKKEFKEYHKKAIMNAQVLADSLDNLSYRLVSGGSETHFVVVDLRNKKISGQQAQDYLERAGILVGRQVVPFDSGSMVQKSGIVLGTLAATTRGLREPHMEEIAQMIDAIISNPEEEVIQDVSERMTTIISQHPMYFREILEMKRTEVGSLENSKT